MSPRTYRSMRFGIAGLAVAAAALAVPAAAGADPAAPSPEASTPGTAVPETSAPQSTVPDSTAPSAPDSTAPQAAAPQADQVRTLPTIPGDAALADLLRKLKATGGDEKAVEAITAILSSDGRLDLSKYLDSASVLNGIGLDGAGLEKLGLGKLGQSDPQTPAPVAATVPTATVPAAPAPAPAADVLTVLQKVTGTSLLSPAVAPLCAEPTPDNPLGLTTAPVLAAPGPWPTVAADRTGALTALTSLLPADSKELLTAIGEDQTAFALVPPGKPDSDQFRVAWFNTTTMKGGLADLKPLSEAASAGPLKQLLTDTENFHGVRLARVDTGKGHILSAVFGTTTTAGRTCFFLPALGTVQN